MIEVLWDTVPFAVGMLLSPLPIIIVLLILLSPSGGAGGVAFGLGRLVGVATVAALVSLLTEVITIESGSSVFSATLRIVLGAALLGFAVAKWRRRPTSPEDVVLPGWMSSVESMSAKGAAGLGLTLSVANPKELASRSAPGSRSVARGCPRARRSAWLSGTP